MKPARIAAATRNPGKLRELRAILGSAGIEIVALDAISGIELPPETGATFGENARSKAIHVSRAVDLPVLGDDSGLEVAALGGRPGVQSARYGGPHASDADKIAKLLAELEHTGGGRGARFVCALALASRGRIALEVEGECRGEIALEPRGSGGFGYDPVFLVPELGRTFGELTEAEKNLRSHRAAALRSLVEALGMN